MQNATCSVENCDNKMKARGWCQAHYSRWQKHGDPRLGGSRRRPGGMSIEEILDMYVIRGAPNECWEWTGRTVHGYGWFTHAGGIHGAHRVSIALALSVTLDSDDHVMHSCDNPPCCNPSHLSVGTAVLNVADMVEKGRAHSGSKVTALKTINESDVRVMRKMREHGLTYKSIAEQFGMSRANVGKICRKEIWNYVD